MPNMQITSPGQDNLTGGTYATDNALFLKVFAGEVLTAFHEHNVMKGLHMERQIQSGKSASFPVTWKTGAAYHTPGVPLSGSQQVASSEKVINIDDFLISDVFVPTIDELKNHYDVRGEYSYQMGAALARAYDQKLQQVAILAARSNATITGGDGGTRVVAATAGTDGSVLLNSLYSAAQALDEHNVDANDRAFIVKPAQYYLIVQAQTANGELLALNNEWGGSGSYSDGRVVKVGGFTITKSNNVPQAVVAANAGENNTYSGDFSATIALALHKSAVGTVKLMDLVTSMTADDGDFMTQYNGTLLTAKYLMGHGILRPEAAIEVASA